MEIIFPGNGHRVPWSLSEWQVFWNVGTEEFEQGDPIVKQSQDIQDYLRSHAVWTDPETGLQGAPATMQAFVNRRELYGDADTDNPVYVEGHAGVVQNVQSMADIHGKLGWHNQLVEEARRSRPEDLLVFYAGLSLFQGLNDNELVAQELAKYGVLILASGIADPTHWDYANTSVIIPRVQALNPRTKIFGYVQTPLAFMTFQAQVDDWAALGVPGIMMDEAGYDYGTNREDFNTRVDYVHAQGLVVMANAWNEDHVFGTVDDPSFPNTSYNPGELESSLNSSDWYLLESAPINTDAFVASGGYQSKGDWAVRGVKAVQHRANGGPNIAACGIIDDANPNGQDLFDFGFVAAMMFSLDAWGASDTLYGAGTSKARWWTRPDVAGMGISGWINPAVQVDANDAEIYWRYVENGRFSIDFTEALQVCTIEKY
jgi:hypothetical protein